MVELYTELCCVIWLLRICLTGALVHTATQHFEHIYAKLHYLLLLICKTARRLACDWSLSLSDDNMLIFVCILTNCRLFLTGQIGQSFEQSIKRSSLSGIDQELSSPHGPGGSATDALTSKGAGADVEAATAGRHAPLFLRHVVGGQFKYRWLALALSAFGCMTIIVTLSVVYSNR